MRKLESWFPEELVVIGVHSGKFIAERETRNVRQAVLRHGITHPVVNDRQFRIWRSYAVNAWPTLVLIDPAGRVVGQQAGELPAEILADAIRRVVARAESEGALDRSLRSFRLEREGEVDRPLRFPAKLLVDAEGGRLYVADTGHHRIVVVQVDAGGRGGEVEAVVGSGVEGLEDGGWGDAKFCEPHGLALAGGTLLARVAPLPGEVVVMKRRTSAFAGSDLAEVLRGGRIDTLVLTGIATSGVVLSTLRQAADLDYRLTVLADACADRDEEVHRVLTEKIFPRQARVTTVDEWIASL